MARRWRPARWAAAMCAIPVLTSCARIPMNAATGARLIVTIQFAGPVNPNYRYFVLIRNANDSSGVNGPIAVVAPPYGNGFATDLHPGSGTAAFTDMVEFGGQPTNSGYAVYHVVGGINGNPNLSQFKLFGDPDSFVRPTDPGSDPKILHFELGLKRLEDDIGTGEPDPANGQLPRFLQVNIIATTKLSFDPQNVDPQKFVDAFGDQHIGSGTFNEILTIDTATPRTYRNNDAAGIPEPDNDTFPGPSDPGVEMTGWSIQITQ